MNLQNPKSSEAFSTCVRCSVRLQQLHAAGADESAEAEDVRSRMDLPWTELDENDTEVLRGLSEDLYSIGVDRESPQRSAVSDNVSRALIRPLQVGQWAQLLAVIRRHEAALPAVDVAVWRGLAWDRIDRFGAVEFYGEASRLAPSEATLRALYLTRLINIRDFEHAETIARRLAQSDALSSDELFTIGQVYFRRSLETTGTVSVENLQRAIKMLHRADHSERPTAAPLTLHSRPTAYEVLYNATIAGFWWGNECLSYYGLIHLGLALDMSGDKVGARSAFQRALDENSDDDLAAQLLNELDAVDQSQRILLIPNRLQMLDSSVAVSVA